MGQVLAAETADSRPAARRATCVPHGARHWASRLRPGWAGEDDDSSLYLLAGAVVRRTAGYAQHPSFIVCCVATPCPAKHSGTERTVPALARSQDRVHDGRDMLRTLRAPGPAGACASPPPPRPSCSASRHAWAAAQKWGSVALGCSRHEIIQAQSSGLGRAAVRTVRAQLVPRVTHVPHAPHVPGPRHCRACACKPPVLVVDAAWHAAA